MGAIGPFWAKWRLRRVPRSTSFLCSKPDDLSATSQRPISTKVGRETYVGVPSQNPEKHFRNFYFRGHLPPKSEIENRSNRHLTQSRLQVTGCAAERSCLLHVVVEGPRSYRGPVNFSLQRTIAERQSCPIFGFWPIFPIQNP